MSIENAKIISFNRGNERLTLVENAKSQGFRIEYIEDREHREIWIKEPIDLYLIGKAFIDSAERADPSLTHCP